MLKKVHFGPSYLPCLLVSPQILITLVFFIWPAGHALYQSLLIVDAFGLSAEFVWLANFEVLCKYEHYLGTSKRTVFLSVPVSGISNPASFYRCISSQTRYTCLIPKPTNVSTESATKKQKPVQKNNQEHHHYGIHRFGRCGTGLRPARP